MPHTLQRWVDSALVVQGAGLLQQGQANRMSAWAKEKPYVEYNGDDEQQALHL
jgi:hypothetical protein